MLIGKSFLIKITWYRCSSCSPCTCSVWNETWCRDCSRI